MYQYHLISFFLGFLLDLILGDPYCLPHPVRFIGWLIVKMEQFLLPMDRTGEISEKSKERRGKMLVLVVLSVTGMMVWLVLYLAYWLHPMTGVLIHSIMTYQALALKCLKTESTKVYKQLEDDNLEGARKAVSMIVGRDTKSLNEAGVAKAAIETVAENLSDGVIAPMLYLAIGGPVLGWLYKAINTMDSMVGYKNEKYLFFGRAAAKLDDMVNYLPARISAWLMVISCFFLGKDFDAKQAFIIYRRDRYQHASPNSAQTEATCAGALGLRLAGDATYFGKTVKKPYIGDELRIVEAKDIVRSNRLLYSAAILCEGICLLAMFITFRILIK